MEIETLRFANAGAQLPCKGYGGGHPFGYGCLECGGSGWVYALPDAVRECCETAHWRPDGECFLCRGRGWVPAEDGWVWWKAFQGSGFSFSLAISLEGSDFQAAAIWENASPSDGLNSCYAINPDPEHACQEALNALLTALGARFPSTVPSASG